MSSHDPARVLRDHALERLRRTLDGAWIELESLEGLDLPVLAERVTRALAPGGQLVCVLPGPRAWRASAGSPRPLGFAEWRRAFEPAIAWRRSSAFGVLVPAAEVWPRRHPLWLGLLATAEHLARSWPLVRARGSYVVHEGVRR